MYGYVFRCYLKNLRHLFLRRQNGIRTYICFQFNISQVGDIIKEIEIEKLKKITKPGQINIFRWK
jgi:hypothetical protein